MTRPLWSRHSLAFWQSIAADPRHPYYVRVAALAYSLHGANGHAPQAHGALSLSLGSADPSTGEFLRYRHATRAIRDAVKLGMLDPASTTRCLVVPVGQIIQGGYHQWPRCEVHGPVKPPANLALWRQKKEESAPSGDANDGQVRRPVERSAPSSGALHAQRLLHSDLHVDDTELGAGAASRACPDCGLPPGKHAIDCEEVRHEAVG